MSDSQAIQTGVPCQGAGAECLGKLHITGWTSEVPGSEGGAGPTRRPPARAVKARILYRKGRGRAYEMREA